MHTLKVRLWATGMAWSVSYFCRGGILSGTCRTSAFCCRARSLMHLSNSVSSSFRDGVIGLRAGPEMQSDRHGLVPQLSCPATQPTLASRASAGSSPPKRPEGAKAEGGASSNHHERCGVLGPRLRGDERSWLHASPFVLSWPDIAVRRTACFRTPMSRPSRLGTHCSTNRDHRDKPGDDKLSTPRGCPLLRVSIFKQRRLRLSGQSLRRHGRA
jgi:hypothetical protein